MSVSSSSSSFLKADKVDLKGVRAACISGSIDNPGVRSKCWKLLLNYLPTVTKEQREKLTIHRDRYALYVQEFVVQSGGGTNNQDHPLTSEPSSNWNDFFADNEVLLQINKDCHRLCPEFDFFHRTTVYPSSVIFGSPNGILSRRVERSHLQSDIIANTSSMSGSRYALCHRYSESAALLDSSKKCFSTPASFKNSSEKQPDNTSSGERHSEVIQRILFLYYKTHTSPGYVQGMNEVIAPLYYVFASDPSEHCRRHAEADTFFCFNNLMTEISPNFIRKMDFDHSFGIGSQFRTLTKLLSRYDNDLSSHLSRLGLIPEHYAFRWFSLLLAREFLLPDVIQIWDVLLADEKRFDMLPFVCCAMLLLIRSQLLEADFPTAVHLVQNYPKSVSLNSILNKADRMYSNKFSLADPNSSRQQ